MIARVVKPSVIPAPALKMQPEKLCGTTVAGDRRTECEQVHRSPVFFRAGEIVGSMPLSFAAAS
jgi:hypothetical protein